MIIEKKEKDKKSREKRKEIVRNPNRARTEKERNR